MPDAAELGQRLRKRREGFEAPRSLVSEWGGLDEERIAALENGGHSTAEEFHRLCQALAVSPGALYQGDDTSPRRSVARFRAAAFQPEPTDVRLLASAAELSRVLGHLLQLLGRKPGLTGHHQVRPPGDGELWKEGYDLGESARGVIAPDAEPIRLVEASLANLDVHVARVSFSTGDIEAASLWENAAVPMILLNTSAPAVDYPLARRAILCHELCHLLHDAGESDLTTMTSWTERTGNYYEAVEVRARAFAPAFIAPRPAVRQWVDQLSANNTSGELAVKIAEHWGLSFEGAVWHAKNCGLLSERDAPATIGKGLPGGAELSHSFEADAGSFPPSMVHKDLPDAASPIVDGRAALLVVEALEEGAISVGRAREILLWR